MIETCCKLNTNALVTTIHYANLVEAAGVALAQIQAHAEKNRREEVTDHKAAKAPDLPHKAAKAQPLDGAPTVSEMTKKRTYLTTDASGRNDRKMVRTSDTMPGKRVRDRSGLPYIHFRVPQYRRTPPVDDMKQMPKKGKKR